MIKCEIVEKTINQLNFIDEGYREMFDNSLYVFYKAGALWMLIKSIDADWDYDHEVLTYEDEYNFIPLINEQDKDKFCFAAYSKESAIEQAVENGLEVYKLDNIQELATFINELKV
jgi:hypothetical protein